jgi:choline kinase
MIGIILCAGKGTRLLDLTTNQPKGLLKVKDKPILTWLLEAFRVAGIKKMVLVVGYKWEKIFEEYGFKYKDMDIVYIRNSLYEHTNNMYSLWLAKDFIKKGCVFSNGDNYLDPSLIKKLADSKHENAVLVDDKHAVDEESMKVKYTKGVFQGFSKTMPVSEAQGEFCGVVKVSKKGAERLVACLDDFILEGHVTDWFEMAFKPESDFQMVSTNGKTFVEVDFIKDLERAWNS